MTTSVRFNEDTTLIYRICRYDRAASPTNDSGMSLKWSNLARTCITGNCALSLSQTAHLT